ncbi:hypothetical protein [Streptococcus halotolerans]|uniref:hypothetical protein n=1 Tax=Streptococcus halotolerans TaxID=1814128 RepID=UPI000787DD95|nr:hypothetical protein [Streptococcus halotolerans]
MFTQINHYLSYQGLKYTKPERAGAEAAAMEAFKSQGQAARAEMMSLSKLLEDQLTGLRIDRVSNWANQAQVARPHFWTYFFGDDDAPDDVAMAIRLYGEQDHFGVSVEVSFIERKKSDQTLMKQAKVLDIPIALPLYYLVQVNGNSHREDGTEANRRKLQESLEAGDVRKVLVKKDIPMRADMSLEVLLPQLVEAFQELYPYYEACKN